MNLNLKKIQISVRYFDEICRTCSNKGDLISIFEEFNSKLKIAEMIEAVTSVHINADDNLPNQICKICLKKLGNCYEFIKQCEKFDSTFRSFANSGYTPVIIEKLMVNDDQNKHKKETKINQIKYETFREIDQFYETTQLDNAEFTKVNEVYVCQSCGVISDKYEVFTEHLNTHSIEITDNTSVFEINDKEGNVDSLKSVLSEQLNCRICNREFNSAQGLRIHNAFHKSQEIDSKKFSCTFCNKRFHSSKGLRNHYKYHTDKLYECKICNKGFTFKTRLEMHLRTHTGEKPFLCNDCGKVFSSRTSLKIHELTHTGARPHLCKICNRRFKQQSHLKNHLLTHSGVKSFVCNCGKAFTFKGNLTVHMRMHSGEKPYMCSVCNRGFCDSSRMKKHRKTHFTHAAHVQ